MIDLEKMKAKRVDAIVKLAKANELVSRSCELDLIAALTELQLDAKSRDAELRARMTTGQSDLIDLMTGLEKRLAAAEQTIAALRRQ